MSQETNNKPVEQSQAQEGGEGSPASSSSDVLTASKGMTLEQLDALLDSRQATDSEPTQEAEQEQETESNEPEEQAAAAPKSEDDEDADPKPEPEPEAGEEKESESKDPGRFRLRAADYKEAEVYRLRKEGMSLQEAYAKVYGEPAKEKPAEEAKEKPADKAPDFDAQLKANQDAIADIEKKITEAHDNVDYRTVLTLERERNALLRKSEKIEQAQAAAVQQAAQKEESLFRQQERESALEAYKVIPELSQKDHAIRKEFEAFVQKHEGNPRFEAILSSPDWPEIMALKFAASRPKSAQPAASNSAPKKPAQPPASQRASAAKVLTPGNQAGQGAAVSKEALLTEVKGWDPKKIDALL